MGRETEAEAYFRKALHAYELLDESHGQPETLDIIYSLANTLAAQHRLHEARVLYQEVLEKSEPDSLAALKVRHSLATLDSKLGDYDKAVVELGVVIAHYDKSGSIKDLQRLCSALGDLGMVYQEKGDFRAAEAAFKRALSLRRTVSKGRPSVGAAVSNLASLYSAIGDNEQALPLFREALEIHRSLLGEEHPLTATSLTNLASVLEKTGQRAEARRLLEQVLELRRKTNGDNSVEVGEALSNLGVLDLSSGDYTRALPLLKNSVEILKDGEGSDYATALGNLGSAYDGLGRYKEAEAAFKSVLSLGDPDSKYVAHNNLALLYIDAKKPEQALSQARAAGESHFDRLKEIFSFTSERQRLSFMREKNPYGLYASLGSADDLFLTALRFKGAVLDSMVEDQRLARASQDPEVGALLLELAEGKSEMLRLEHLAADDPARKGLAVLRSRHEQAETEVARRVAGIRGGRDLFAVTPAQVQAALPARTVLVEFLHHGFYLGQGKSEKRYSALVVTGDGVRLVGLGSAQEIDALVGQYRETIQGRRSATRAGRVLAKTTEVSSPAALSTSYDKLWAPVAAALPEGTESLILSPDGELNFVSFATLLGPDGRFVGESLNLSYVSSGRDLVLTSSAPASGSALVGAPEFGVPAHPDQADRIVLSPLPGTQEECSALRDVLAQRGEKPAIRLGKEATEPQLVGLPGGQVLHIATHGLFLSPKLGLENPMARSGLALTGAQTTLDAWAEGKTPDPASDGFLSASEVGVMDLRGTRLVVLSACDTGLGTAEDGEGVLGLRRGFVQSGAANLVFTLWPIDDQETARFMVDFYQALGKESPRVALSATQRAWLTRMREAEGSLTAARLAGPFVLSSRGGL